MVLFQSVLLVRVKIVRNMARRNPIQSGWLESTTLREKPSEDEPILPPGLSDLPDDLLMDLLVDFTNWTGYAGYQVALNEIAERKAERNLQRVFDRYSIVHKKEKTVAATKAMVQQEEEYLDAEDAVELAYAITKLSKSEYTHLEAASKVVSRELSRRISRRDLENRADKYST